MNGLWRVLILISCNSLLALTNVINTLPSVTVFEGSQEASFVCSAPVSFSSIRWIVNGSSLEDLNLGNVTTTGLLPTVGSLTFLATPLDFNGTTVQCNVTFAQSGTSAQSNVATLLVQGLLEAVSDVSVQFVSPLFIISWRAPFTLNVPGSPNISYCISIITGSTGSSLANECGIIAMSYSVALESRPCVEYTAIITPSNEVGNGTSTTKIFPGAPGVVATDNVTRVAQPDGVLVYEILLQDPVCTCEVALPGTTINCTVDGSSVTFRIGDPFFNQFLVTTVTLHNVRLNTSSSVNISTHDVDAIAVNAAVPNAVDLSASYVENSPALGVLFVLLLSGDVGGVDYTQSVFLVLDRAMANGFMQANVTEGNYTVLAFDVEGDGVVELGPSTPAAVGSVTVHGQDLPAPFPYPRVAGLQCSVDPENDSLGVSYSLQVSCNSSVFLGYFVVLHSAGSIDIVVNESREYSTPVEFVDLNSGLHSVTVFPLTDSGIVGTSVAYTEQINLAAPTTISPITSSSESPTTDATAAPSPPLPGTPETKSDTSQLPAIIAVVVLLILIACLIAGVVAVILLWKYRSKKRNSESIPDSPDSLEDGEYKSRDQAFTSKRARSDGPQVKATEPLYAEAIAVRGGSSKAPRDETTVLYSEVHRTVNADNLQYELVQLKSSKQPTIPTDANKVEYAELALAQAKPKPSESSSTSNPPEANPPEANPPEAKSLEASAMESPLTFETKSLEASAMKTFESQPLKSAPEEAPRVLTREEVLTLLLPMEARWKEFGEALGCGEDLLDEIFTNNETSRECLRNVSEFYHLRKTRANLASTVREMGETELAACIADEQAEWLLPGQPTT